MNLVARLLAPLLLISTPAVAEDWSGPYVGLGVTQTEVEALSINVADETLFSIIGGVRTELGNGFVIGAEADYNNTSFNSGYLGSARAVGGLQVMDGAGLLYLTAGYADINSSLFSGGVAVGGGYEHKVTDALSLRVDVINHRLSINDIGPSIDGLNVDFLNFRGAVAYSF